MKHDLTEAEILADRDLLMEAVLWDSKQLLETFRRWSKFCRESPENKERWKRRAICHTVIVKALEASHD